MPYFFRIMDELSKSKPLSTTYFALWCRLWDESGLITIKEPTLVAEEAGFSGQRAVRTWRDRMKILEKLGFIRCKPFSSNPFGYVLLLNPYGVVKRLWEKKKYTNEGWYNALREYASSIKAADLES